MFEEAFNVAIVREAAGFCCQSEEGEFSICRFVATVGIKWLFF